MNKLILTTTLLLGAAACAEPTAPEAQTETGEKAKKKPGSKPGSKPATGGPGKLSLGAAAPMVNMPMIGTDGGEHSIQSAAKKNGVMVLFTCNHCPWVKAWEERTVAAGNLALTKDIGVIAVNSNDPEAYSEDDMNGMKARAEKAGMEYPYVTDDGSRIAKAFGADKTPEVYMFDADMKLVYHGTIDDNAKKPGKVEKTYLVDAIKAVATGQEPNPAQTKALGCSIKFQSS
ncbi:MAG: thioredoxin family protein [Myxococcota bacterium]